jgi:hypothetical protein
MPLAFSRAAWLAGRMAKTIAMLTLMAALVGATTACFGLFQGKSDEGKTDPCAGLVGQEKEDCEKRIRGETRLM